MNKNFKAEWIVIEYSERRIKFKETNEIIFNKNRTAINDSLNIILCLGERLEDRIDGIVFDVIIKHIYAKHLNFNTKSTWAKDLYIDHIKVFNGFIEDDGSGKLGKEQF